MKYRNLLLWFVLLSACILLLENCATDGEVARVHTEECCGLWINQEYNTVRNKAAKIIYYPDGTWMAFESENTAVPSWKGTISITESWKDRSGNYWYRVTTNQMGYNSIVYELWRLDESCTTLEGVWSFRSSPVEFDRECKSYTIYFRPESLKQAAYEL